MAPRTPTPIPQPQLSPMTADFLLAIVNGLTLNVGAEDFDDALAQVVQARSELRAIIDSRP